MNNKRKPVIALLAIVMTFAALTPASASHGADATRTVSPVAWFTEPTRAIGVSSLNLVRAGLNPSTPPEQLAAIEDYADGALLSGLSPASLTSVETQIGLPGADLAAIARWAQTQGLTGLSPASLHPIDR